MSLLPWRVEAMRADRITVACHPCRRLLFPRATDFIDTPERMTREQVEEIERKAAKEFPDAQRVITRNGHPEGRPQIEVEPMTGVDVCVVPRFKKEYPHRNWGGWQELVSHLSSKGLRVVSLGTLDMSMPVCEAIYATDRMAAAIRGAKLTVSTDTGPAHLANLLGGNLALVWGSPVGVIPGQSYREGWHACFQRQASRPIHHIEGGWEDVEKVIAVVEGLL